MTSLVKNRETGRFELSLVVAALATHLPAVLTLASSEAAHIPVDMSEQLLKVCHPWKQIALNPSLRATPISKAISALPSEVKLDRSALEVEYAAKVLDGATGAYAAWQKYMPEALAQLSRRHRFEPSLPPTPIPVSPGQSITFNTLVWPHNREKEFAWSHPLPSPPPYPLPPPHTACATFSSACPRAWTSSLLNSGQRTARCGPTSPRT